jgi:hypothetical protein
MNRFQYRIVNMGMFNAADRMATVFGALGSQGWELVGMYDKSSNWFNAMEKGFALFKRVVAEGEEPDGAWAEWTMAAEHRPSPPGGQKPSMKVHNPSPEELARLKEDPNYGAW